MIGILKEKNEKQNTLIGGAVSLALATLLVKLLGVLYKIPLASVLGDLGMGYFNSAYTVYGFFYILCTAGVPKAIMLILSERRQRSEDTSGFLKLSIEMFAVFGFLVSLLLVILARPLSAFIGSSESYATMICVAPSVIFSSVAGVLRGKLNFEMRLPEIALSQIIDGAVKLAAGLAFAMMGVRMNLSVYMISALTILGATLGSFVSLIYLLIVSKSLNKNIKTEQKEKRYNIFSTLSQILRLSLPITVSSALMSLSGTLDLFLVMRGLIGLGYSEAEANALFGNYTTTAQSLFNFGIALITPISLAYMPTLAGKFSSGNMRGFSDDLKSALKSMSFVSAPVTLGVAVFSKEILRFLFGTEAASVGAPLLMLLAPGIIFMSFILILNCALESVCRPGLAMVSMIIGAVVKALCSGFLLSFSDVGISAAPIGTVISYAVSSLVSLLFLSHMLKYNVPILSTALLPYLNASSSVLLARVFYDRILPSVGMIPALLVTIFISAVIYLILSAFSALSSGEKIPKMAKSTNFI